MKKLITILIFISLTIVGFGQTYAGKGIRVGKSTTNGFVRVIDSITVDNKTIPTLFKVYAGVTQLNPDIPTGSQVDGSIIFVKQLQDTISFTADTKTLALTDAGKIIYCSNANYQEITIPTNGAVAFPIGTVITFINTGPGIIRIEPAATVIRKSVLDSCTMNTVNQTYQIIKRAINKWYFIGDFRD